MKSFSIEINDASREALAAYAHDAWSRWMTYLFEVSDLEDGEAAIIPSDKVKRWQRQRCTPYEELPINERLSDQEEADKILATLNISETKDYGPGFLGAFMGTSVGAYYDMGVTKEEVLALVGTMFDGIKETVENGSGELAMRVMVEGTRKKTH